MEKTEAAAAAAPVGQPLTKNELITEYKRLNPYGHWFDTDTVSFFKSIISESTIKRAQPPDIAVFISSEKPPHGKRRYTVRILREDGDIQNVGKFMEYASQGGAARRLKAYLEGRFSEISP